MTTFLIRPFHAGDVGRARHAAYPYDVPVIQQVIPAWFLGYQIALFWLVDNR